ncbi:MAG: hypothetical protein ABIC91_02715 [Nanoarchaeota archaeon]
MAFADNFVELMFLILLVLGLFTSLLTNLTFFHYLIIFLFGIIVISLSSNVKKPSFPFFIIIIGFVLGFLIGTGKNRFLIFIIFILGIITGFLLKNKIKPHLKK